MIERHDEIVSGLVRISHFLIESGPGYLLFFKFSIMSLHSPSVEIVEKSVLLPITGKLVTLSPTQN